MMCFGARGKEVLRGGWGARAGEGPNQGSCEGEGTLPPPLYSFPNPSPLPQSVLPSDPGTPDARVAAALFPVCVCVCVCVNRKRWGQCDCLDWRRDAICLILAALELLPLASCCLCRGPAPVCLLKIVELCVAGD